MVVPTHGQFGMDVKKGYIISRSGGTSSVYYIISRSGSIYNTSFLNKFCTFFMIIFFYGQFEVKMG